MKIIRFGILPLLIAAYAVSQTPSAEKKSPSGSDRERLIGAWHLASISGPDGKPVTTGVPVGMLVYTRDGHMSVQLMYPKSASALSNEYVQSGYEASFGSYDIKGPAARLPIQHGPALDYQVGPTGRTLVGYVGALLTASTGRRIKMPHVIIKLWPGKSQQQKTRLADKISKDVMDVLNYGEESVSVGFEEIKSQDWKERVHKPDIQDKWDQLYKKPGYEM